MKYYGTSTKDTSKEDKDDIKSLQLFYKPGLYAITINPCDKKQYFRSEARVLNVKKYMYSLLELYGDDDIRYHLYWELSEPKDNAVYGKQGSRLHFHGFIRFLTNKSVKRFLLYHQSLMAIETQYKIEHISDKRSWYNYCVKQQKIIDITPISNVESLKEMLQEGKGNADAGNASTNSEASPITS